jgi:hypothetical protein
LVVFGAKWTSRSFAEKHLKSQGVQGPVSSAGRAANPSGVAGVISQTPGKSFSVDLQADLSYGQLFA